MSWQGTPKSPRRHWDATNRGKPRTLMERAQDRRKLWYNITNYKETSMATADQIKSLIRSHYGNQREQFSTIALQVAAHEAMQGHQSVALEIRGMVDGAKVKDYERIVPFTPDLEHLIRIGKSDVKLSQLVVSDTLKTSLLRVLNEYRQRAKLERYGMTYRRKILLAGSPGTGKTMTASIFASELGLPLYVIQLDKIVTKFMGETSAKLRLVFEGMRDRKGVYLFDEFDTIGGERAKDNDVGEMRRVLNSFLQFIENDPSDSLIVCATNNPGLLDQALFRRFDDVLRYELPDADSAKMLIRNRLANFIARKFSFKDILKTADGMSHADITHACDDAIKTAILSDKKCVSADMLFKALSEKKGMSRLAFTRR